MAYTVCKAKNKTCPLRLPYLLLTSPPKNNWSIEKLCIGNGFVGEICMISCHRTKYAPLHSESQNCVLCWELAALLSAYEGIIIPS